MSASMTAPPAAPRSAEPGDHPGRAPPDGRAEVRGPDRADRGARSFSFDDLEALSNRVANCLVSTACSRRPGRAVRPELLGVGRRVLRDREDRRGRDPGQLDAHARRGRVRRRELRGPRRRGVADKGESLLDLVTWDVTSCCGATTRPTGRPRSRVGRHRGAFAPRAPRRRRPRRPSATPRGRRVILRARCRPARRRRRGGGDGIMGTRGPIASSPRCRASRLRKLRFNAAIWPDRRDHIPRFDAEVVLGAIDATARPSWTACRPPTTTCSPTPISTTTICRV